MKDLIEKINLEFEVFQADARLQSEKGNKAAGTRARKSTLALEKLLKEFRKESLEAAKA
ncbi:histone H1 [Elizabethkingia occulta]|uniref:histone H1 n=1 Tax=Elizabethkingia occulta TaxID=1867263 RepID=UPI00398C81D3